MHLLFAARRVLYNRIKPYLLLVVLLVIPMVLISLPADFFDQGESICPSKRFLNKDCPGCGITRGIMHTIHLEFQKAWGLNKLTFVVLPTMIYFWVKWMREIWSTIQAKV
jgi:hypothetical protein